MNFISETSKILLEDLRLSNNPDTEVVDDKDGIDGKINMTEDGRKFYVGVFTDPTNPLAAERYRVISQTTDSNDNPVWRAGRPSKMKKFVGNALPGDIITREVEEYEVGENTVSIYSCVVLKGESIKTVFRQQGHELINDIDDEFIETVKVEDAPEVESNAPEVTIESKE